MFYTKESQTSEIIAALLSLKTESKGKRFFKKFSAFEMAYRKTIEIIRLEM